MTQYVTPLTLRVRIGRQHTSASRSTIGDAIVRSRLQSSLCDGAQDSLARPRVDGKLVLPHPFPLGVTAFEHFIDLRDTRRCCCAASGAVEQLGLVCKVDIGRVLRVWVDPAVPDEQAFERWSDELGLAQSRGLPATRMHTVSYVRAGDASERPGSSVIRTRYGIQIPAKDSPAMYSCRRRST